MRHLSLRRSVTVTAATILVLTAITTGILSAYIILGNYRGLLEDDLSRQTAHILEEAAPLPGNDETIDRVISDEPFSTRFVTYAFTASGDLIARSPGPTDIVDDVAEDLNSLSQLQPTSEPVDVTIGDTRLLVYVAQIPQFDGILIAVVGSADALQEDALAISFLIGGSGLVIAALGVFVLIFLLGKSVKPIQEVAVSTRTIDVDAAMRITTPTHPTEAKVLANEINELLERIDKAALERHQLLASISHEMRTPLAIARGQLESLSSYYADDDEVRDAASRARAEIERVSVLVDSALTLARSAAPGFVIPQDINLEVFAQEIAIRTSALDGLVVVHKAPSENVVIDTERIAQAILNLIMNSRVHNPDGVRVDVYWDVTPSALQIRVEDDGIGFPNKPQQELTRPFSSGRSGSSGLGLAVVSSIVEAHGGWLTLANINGSGARALIELPREPNVFAS